MLARDGIEDLKVFHQLSRHGYPYTLGGAACGLLGFQKVEYSH